MRIVRIIALILVIAVLFFGWRYMNRLEAQDNARMRELYTQAEPLERERETLIKQRDALPSEYALQFRDYATVELLFPKMDTQIYSEAYPLMRERNITGTLGLSPTEYPAGWNKLTEEEFKRLLSDGWGMALVYENAWGDYGYFFQAVSALCTAYNVPMPTTIYYPNNDYTPEADAILKENGIKTVVVNASDGRSSTVTDITGDLWFTGAMPWSYTGSDTDLQLLARTDGANMTYTMNFTETWKDQKTGESKGTLEEKSFTAFLDSWQEMLFFESPLDSMEHLTPDSSIFINTNDKDQLYELYLQELTPEQQVLLPCFRSTTYEQAIEFHRQAMENSQSKQAELDAQIAELDAQIAELDKQIDDIYAQWNDAGKKKS